MEKAFLAFTSAATTTKQEQIMKVELTSKGLSLIQLTKDIILP